MIAKIWGKVRFCLRIYGSFVDVGGTYDVKLVSDVLESWRYHFDNGEAR